MTKQTLFLERINTPTGWMSIVTDDEERVRAVDWENHESRMQGLLRRHHGADTGLSELSSPSTARRALEAYFQGELQATAKLVTLTNGTAFQRSVWAGLRSIPSGQTMSYGGLAKKIGHPKAMRAVGLANGSNPIAIIVPCHRVIGADGSLTGFGGGIERKRWLLAHEGIYLSSPKRAASHPAEPAFHESSKSSRDCPDLIGVD
jgi:methylated-DNA-[protein]-cysteine S-methyltransferase